MSIEQSTPMLSRRLQRRVSYDQLQENAANYEEMQWNLSSDEQVDALAVESVLMQLDLNHATFQPEPGFRELGILPSAEMTHKSDRVGNTFELDRDLGLDEYVFMGIGTFTSGTMYGHNNVAVDGAILVSERTIVTPNDLCNITAASRSFKDLGDDTQEMIQSKYFDKIVRGKDWVRILSRRILRDLIETDFEPYSIKNYMMLGEVKHRGVVGSEYIKDFIQPDDIYAKHGEIMRLGFVPRSVEGFIPNLLPGIDTQADLYAKMGADINTARQTWADVFSKARTSRI